MATPINIGLLESFSPVFVFIFVFAISYAVLGLTGVLGKDNKNIHGIVAFCIAIFLSLSVRPKAIITDMVPWFALVIVFFMFLMLAMRFVFGEKGDRMMINVLGSESGAGWWVFIAIIGILIISLSSSVGPSVTSTSNESTAGINVTTAGGSTQTGNWQTNVLNTMYHPKVLGTIIILVIALAAIRLLSSIPK